MDYQMTLDYLFTRLPMYSRIGAAAYKADLDNTIALCDHLNNPQHQFKSIHIAGTNGKGSTSHMLAAVLQSAGYKTGLYTSPHLRDFRERIKVNGEMIPEEAVVSFTESIKPLIEKLEPSFFEITVAMAFDYFVKEKVDIAIIETGLGGRLDSTNIIVPELSIITNIGWDHMNMLGNTLEKITLEKAGIIKNDVPVIIGEYMANIQPIFEKIAMERKSPLTIASQKRYAADWSWDKNELLVSVGEENKTDHQVYHLDLPGIYQVKNLLTVLEACHQLKRQDWNIENEIIHKALRQVKKLTGLHGRWDIIHHTPLVVLDVAHNEDGMQQLTRQIELFTYHELHIVIGMVKDKEVEKVLSILPKEAHYYFTKAQIPRAMFESELKEIALSAGLQGEIFGEVNQALSSALGKAHKDDLIIVCGSVFLVGEVEPIPKT